MKIHPPETVVIEVTNLCNLRCEMCVSHGPRASISSDKRPPYMEFENIKKLLNEAYALNKNAAFSPQFQGEPLMHKDIVKIIRHARDLGIKNIGFNTNAMLLNEQMSEDLLDAGLTDICFSVDGLTKHTYESIRTGAKHETVYKNILCFIGLKDKINKKVKTSVTFTVFEKNKNEEEEFIKFWFPLVDCVNINNMAVDGKPLLHKSHILKRVPCPDLFRFMVILTNGDVVPCCRDYEYKMVMGNAVSESIKKVWEGEKYNAVRRLHNGGEFNRLPVCDDCCTWQVYFPVEEAIEKNKLTRVYSFHKSIYNKKISLRDYIVHYIKNVPGFSKIVKIAKRFRSDVRIMF